VAEHRLDRMGTQEDGGAGRLRLDGRGTADEGSEALACDDLAELRLAHGRTDERAPL
jgi:hypothetical protein